MKSFLSNIYDIIVKSIYYIYYILLSEKERLTTKRVSKIIYEKPFVSGKVMLLALYEKTTLRSDTIELLAEAKRKGIFIIAVNTLKVSAENYQSDIIDVYIEKDNFGRDFGSYKAGFEYLESKGIADACERLLIINDSVFFSKKGISKFLDDLFDTNIEVLGATENREISYHLGSFCISIAGSIVRDFRFKDYWKNYKLTNVRPLVIKRGEFELSSLLKRLASNEKNFSAIYNLSYLMEIFNNDDEFLSNYYLYRREGSDLWIEKYLYLHFIKDPILKSFYDLYIKEKCDHDDDNHNEKYPSYLEISNYIASCDFNSIENGKVLKDKLVGIYLTDFQLGSQIHNNCIALHHLGLPIIKLDLLYRGVCDLENIIKLTNQIPKEQQEDFFDMITSRPYGKRFLYGINRKAFIYGLL